MTIHKYVHTKIQKFSNGTMSLVVPEQKSRNGSRYEVDVGRGMTVA